MKKGMENREVKNRMRILHITNTFYPAWAYGGIARVAYELCKKLIDRGHDVTVFTTDAYDKSSRIKRGSNKPVIIAGIKVYRFRNISNWLAWKRYHTPISLIPFAKREVKEFDVIHIHGFRSTMHIPLCYYAKKYGIPYIIDPEGSIAATFQNHIRKVHSKFFGHRILRDAHKVIAGTEMEIDEEKSMGVDNDKIALILPGYNTKSFSNLPDSGQFRNKFGIKEKNIILFLARIHEIKGIDFLVESFHELTRSRNDVVLVITGPDDGYKSTVKKLIDKLDLSNKALFTGYLGEDEKLSAYVDATMLVQPSKYERFCGSPFEAILCDTPIIVTKDTGCGNFVDKMDMGYAVEYGDITALRDMMDRVLNDPSEAQLKTQKCKQYIINNLTLEKQVEKYEKLYQDAIEGLKQ